MRVTLPMEWLVARIHDGAALAICLLPPTVLGLAALRSQPSTTGYESATYDPVINARIAEYVDIVKETKSYDGRSDPDGGRLRGLAAHWIQQTESGKLRPLPLQRFDDTVQNGVKGEILAAALSVSQRMQDLARREARDGRYDLASKDVLSSARVLQCIRYSDLVSVAIVSGMHRNVFRRLDEWLPRASERTRLSLKSTLDELKPNVKQLDRVIAEAERFDAIETQRRIDVALANDADPETGESSTGIDRRKMVRVAEREERESDRARTILARTL